MTKLNLQTLISSYAERLKHTPKVHSDRGYWTGDRGNSLYCPKNAKVLDALHKLDLLGMPYIDAIAYNGFIKEKEYFMTNYDLMNFLILLKDKSQLIHLLNQHRISINQSKYC